MMKEDSIKRFDEDALSSMGLSDEDAAQYSNYLIIPIDKIKKAPWNYKGEDDYTSEKLNANLKRNGQMENIIVRELDDDYFEVGNGNHRIDQFIALGKTHVLAYNCGAISEAEIKRIALETNETKFSADRQKLGIIVAELHEDFSANDLAVTLPFTEAELESYLMIAEIDLPSTDREMEVLTNEPLPDDRVSSDRMEELAILAGHNTAIARSKPSKTIEFFEKNELLKGDILDYGSGYEVHDYNKFDPSCAANYDLLQVKYDTIMCNYVLNILPLPHNRFELVLAVKALLKSYGSAYFTVKDRKKGDDTETERGSFECGWDQDDWDDFFKRFKAEKVKAKFPCWKIVKEVDTVNF